MTAKVQRTVNYSQVLARDNWKCISALKDVCKNDLKAPNTDENTQDEAALGCSQWTQDLWWKGLDSSGEKQCGEEKSPQK